MEKYLIFNQGSTSIRAVIYNRYSLFGELKKLITINCELEKIENGAEFSKATFKYKIFVEHENKKIIESPLKKTNYANLLVKILEIFKKYLQDHNTLLAAIGIRIVAPGVYFTHHNIIEKQFLKNLKIALFKDPLHIEPTRELIAQIQKMFQNVVLIAISDSQFHNNFPVSSKLYGLKLALAKKYEIYRYGYHGLSAQSIVNKLIKRDKLPKKLIICHLGSGSSITAIDNGKSINNSMGFSPLDGLISATRSGSIDPSAVLYLFKEIKKNLNSSTNFTNKTINANKNLSNNLDQFINFLYNENGLLGLSQVSGNMKTLLSFYPDNKKVKTAIDLYCNKIKEYIGAYTALMNGLDMLIFTGGIGHNAPEIRQLICSNMEFLSLKLDNFKNCNTNLSDTYISQTKDKVKILSMETDEEYEIACLTHEIFLNKSRHEQK